MFDFDRLTVLGALAAGRELALSAMPDAPVVATRPRRKRRRVRGFAEHLLALRPRLQATRLEKEEPCAT
jgi:hypothetical protein